jgi:hypothetical protein
MSLTGLLIAASVGSAGPLANAEAGMLQCYRPNDAARTCQSIASYRRTGPGTYDNKAVIPVSDTITLETHTPVMLKGDAVCGFIRQDDIIAGTLRVGGERVDPEKARPMLERLGQAAAPMTGKEICTRYVPSGADLTAKISIAGQYRPEQDETVKWISAEDRYTVTP